MQEGILHGLIRRTRPAAAQPAEVAAAKAAPAQPEQESAARWGQGMWAARAALIGALTMALGAVTQSLWWGFGLLFPARLVGATFIGPKALVGGLGVVLWGLALYGVVCLVLGAIYVCVVGQRLQGARAAVVGVTLSLAFLAVAVTAFLPWSSPYLLERIQVHGWTAIALNVLFGVGLAFGAAKRPPPAQHLDQPAEAAA